MTETTGMLMFGKMSVCIVTIDKMPSTAIKSATTTKVYGRRRASRTIHMAHAPFRQSWVEQRQAGFVINLPPNGPGRRGQHQFHGWADGGLKQMPAASRAISQTHSHVD